MKLYDAFGWAYQESMVHKFEDNEGGIVEEHFGFSVSKSHDYVIMIYYQG